MDLATTGLENEFVRLEPLDEAHREALRPVVDDVSLWTASVMRADGAHFDAWFDAMLGAHRDGKHIGFAVFDRRGDAWAGHSAFLNILPAHQRVEIGWTVYGSRFHRGHVNPACKRLLLGHAFHRGAERVELKTRANNLRSQGAMEKMGAVREGTLRRDTRVWTGERRDTVYFSVLAEEWPAVRDGLDARLTAIAGSAA